MGAVNSTSTSTRSVNGDVMSAQGETERAPLTVFKKDVELHVDDTKVASNEDSDKDSYPQSSAELSRSTDSGRPSRAHLWTTIHLSFHPTTALQELTDKSASQYDLKFHSGRWLPCTKTRAVDLRPISLDKTLKVVEPDLLVSVSFTEAVSPQVLVAIYKKDEIEEKTAQNSFVLLLRPARADDVASQSNTELKEHRLYRFNMAESDWSNVQIRGSLPPCRVGHTWNVVGNRIYLFGGKVGGSFLNDIWILDLHRENQALHAECRLAILDGNTQRPLGRGGHTSLARGTELFVFGGKDSKYCYNDTWRFDTETNVWEKLKCTGFIPAPRESHAATLQGDFMYVFGGKGADGSHLHDLSVFSIKRNKWHTFRSTRETPSSGWNYHMISIDAKVLVIDDELPTDYEDCTTVHVLHTRVLHTFLR